MARPRQTRAALARLNAQFIQYGITERPTYDEYIKLVDNEPITRRELKKLFLGRWERLLKVLVHYYPSTYEDAKAAHKPTPAPKPAPKKASGLEALKSKSSKTVEKHEDE